MTDGDEGLDLYKEYYDRVVRYLMRRFGFTDEEARDLAQDVFLGVFRHMEHAPITAMWLFLKTSAHNRAVNEIRSRGIRRRTESGSVDARPDLPDILLRDFWTDEPPRSPESEASHNEEVARLRRAIEGLPALLRTCVLLRLEGYSYQEIAAALRTTVDAVRTRLRDAKKLLLARLRPEEER